MKQFQQLIILIGFIFTSLLSADTIRIEVVQAEEITPYVRDITELCLTVFKEYPYLYEGTHEEYGPYIADYAKSNTGKVCLLFDQDKLVGVCTGTAMNTMRSHFQQPWLTKIHQNLSFLFYIGELILLREYCGKGYGKQLYLTMEQLVKNSGKFDAICFCTIDEFKINAEKPEDYNPHDSFWISLGFTFHPELNFSVDWLNVGETQESPHTLIYWSKSL